MRGWSPSRGEEEEERRVWGAVGGGRETLLAVETTLGVCLRLLGMRKKLAALLLLSSSPRPNRLALLSGRSPSVVALRLGPFGGAGAPDAE